MDARCRWPLGQARHGGDLAGQCDDEVDAGSQPSFADQQIMTDHGAAYGFAGGEAVGCFGKAQRHNDQAAFGAQGNQLLVRRRGQIGMDGAVDAGGHDG